MLNMTNLLTILRRNGTTRAERVTISPTLAGELLRDRNPLNRKLEESKVSRYVKLLESGEFRCNGETIVFDENALLMNGQHRLAASARSGLALDIFVVGALNREETMSSIDGPLRSIEDVIGIDEKTRGASLAHLSTRASIVHNLACILTGPLLVGRAGSKNKPSNTHALALSKEWAPYMVPAAAYTKRKEFKKLTKAGALFGALFSVFLRVNAQKGMRFIEGLLTGESLAAGTPLYVLRETLLTMQDNLHRHRVAPDRPTQALYTIYAWNAFFSEAKMTRRWDAYDPYPTIAGWTHTWSSGFSIEDVLNRRGALQQGISRIVKGATVPVTAVDVLAAYHAANPHLQTDMAAVTRTLKVLVATGLMTVEHGRYRV